MLLSQSDSTQIARNLRYYDYLLTARRGAMQGYVDAVHKLGALQTELAAAVSALQQTQLQLEQQHQQLQTHREQRQQLLAAADAELAAKGTALEQLQRDRAALQHIIDRIEQQRALAAAREAERQRQETEQQRQQAEQPTPAPQTTPSVAETSLAPSTASTAADSYTGQDLARLQSTAFPSSKGRLPWPVAGKTLNRFGEPRQGSIAWDGLRIRAQAGSEVHAVHYGRVMYADWLRGQGMLLVLDHGDGYMSLYAHNDALLREQGEWVKAGEPIARVGSSGGEKDTALYFEIRKDGQPVNPQTWLRAKP